MPFLKKLKYLLFCLLAVAFLASNAECQQSQEPTIELVGEVIIKSALPAPATAPYPDCLTFLKFKVIEVKNGSFDGSEALVAMWGFRDFKLMEPGSFEVGDIVNIKLVPYKEVENDLSEIMRVDDTEDYESTVYWASEWKIQTRGNNSSSQYLENKSNKDNANKVLEKINNILIAHNGDLIGHPEGRMFFGNYGYLTNDYFWELNDSYCDKRTISIIDAICEFNNYLKLHGIHLVVVFPPSPIAIYPEIAFNVDYKHERDGRIDRYFLKFKNELLKKNVSCVDVLPDLLAQKWFHAPDEKLYPLYFENDLHWNAMGAFVSGKSVANSIKDSDWFRQFIKTYPPQKVVFKEEFIEQDYDRGVYAKDHPDWQIQNPKHFRRKIHPEKGSNFILKKDNEAAPLWILGDSFALFSEFYQTISAELGMPYNVIAYGSASPTTVREEFTRVKDTSNIKLVIWEIAYPFLSPINQNLWKAVKF